VTRVRPAWIDTQPYDADSAYRGKLLCAHCGHDYLHTHSVEVFERAEDEETGLHVKVVGKSAAIDRSMGGNPSARREGMRITFECEWCGEITALSVAQHKGWTLVYQGPGSR
jgi:hypothetical protein